MYITFNEVIERYPMLKTWVGNSPMLNNEIAYAEYELNGRLATHFSVPFSGAHYTIKDICIDLVYYRTLMIKDPAKAKEIKDAVIGRIEGLKSGTELIYTGSGTTIERSGAKAGEIYSTMGTYHPTFSMLDADNACSEIDQDRLDEEENERN